MDDVDFKRSMLMHRLNSELIVLSMYDQVNFEKYLGKCQSVLDEITALRCGDG